MHSGWTMARLSDVANVRDERVLADRGDGRPYVALEHIAQGAPKLLGIVRAGDAVSAKTVFRAGDILYGKLCPALRKVIRVDFDGVCSAEILAIYPTNPDDGAYLHQLLRGDAVLAHALQSTEGTKMPRTSWDDLRTFTFRRPPAGERRKAAEILEAIDAAIGKTDAAAEATPRLRKALLEELLTRGLPGWHTAWKQAPGIGLIPACWSARRLGDLGTEEKSVILTGPFGAELRSSKFTNSGIPVIKLGNVQFDGLDLRRLQYVAEERRYLQSKL